jgi:hypothetical protein
MTGLHHHTRSEHYVGRGALRQMVIASFNLFFLSVLVLYNARKSHLVAQQRGSGICRVGPFSLLGLLRRRSIRLETDKLFTR